MRFSRLLIPFATLLSLARSDKRRSGIGRVPSREEWAAGDLRDVPF